MGGRKGKKKEEIELMQGTEKDVKMKKNLKNFDSHMLRSW